jgi:hypothetical protein
VFGRFGGLGVPTGFIPSAHRVFLVGPVPIFSEIENAKVGAFRESGVLTTL